MLEFVLFAIDDGHNLHKRKKFMHYVDTLRAMGKASTVHLCVGKYKGNLEGSYLMLSKDYDNHIQGREYVKYQESVLRVPGDTRQPCVLEFSDGSSIVAGGMSQVSPEAAMKLDSWTYVEETGKYFTCGSFV